MAIRVEVLLRRQSESMDVSILRVGSLEIDLIKRKVWVAGELVQLLQKEFQLLEFLVRNQGKTVDRRLIFEQVWGCFFEPSENLINVHIGKLRRKLEKAGQPSPIQTVKGEGLPPRSLLIFGSQTMPGGRWQNRLLRIRSTTTFRLTAMLGVAFLCALCLVLGLIYVLTERELISRTDELLAYQAKAFASVPGPPLASIGPRCDLERCQPPRLFCAARCDRP